MRLFPTLARFDAVYYVLFKCNLHRLIDYPQLWAYARDLYQRPGFGDTTDFGPDQAALLPDAGLDQPVTDRAEGPVCELARAA